MIQRLWNVKFGRRTNKKDAWVEVEEAWGGADGEYEIDVAKNVVEVTVAAEKNDWSTEEEKTAALRKGLVYAMWALWRNGEQSYEWYGSLREIAEYMDEFVSVGRK